MVNQQESAEEIFGAVLDLPPEQRSAYLDTACQNSADLRLAVERLLLDHERLGDFLTGTPLAPNGSHSASPVPVPTGAYLAAGRKLGRYTVIAPLGSGGMGAVYQARDEKLERVVAIKVLSPDLFHGDESRERFRKEALALARLSHANIAAVHDVGEENGVDYIVMECIAGQTLAAKLKLGPLPIADALSIAQQVASALEEAHESGVIHRDLKPANIMVTAKGHVKVLDFGIAKLATLDTPNAAMTGDPGTFIGTPLYMSPEQVQGKKVDTRTDLWSLGVVLYESLTGHTPFRGESSFAIMQAIVQQSPEPVTDLRPETPPAVEHIVTQLLQKDPDTRFQSARDAVHDTSSALARIEQPPLTSGPTRPPLAATSAAIPRQSSKKWLWISLAAASVIAIAIGIGIALHPTPPKTSELDDSTAIPLTTYQGSETFPSFSPDGNQVAFQWDGEKQDNYDIYVKGLGPDAAPLRLTTSPAPDGWPAWSPDGRTIAFQRTVAPNRLNLMLIPALGGPERKLAELTIGGDSWGFAPAWSSDSKWLIVVNLAGEHLALFRVSVETGELTQITPSQMGLEDVFPAISPDGKMLLFNRRQSYYNWGTPYTVRLDENASPIGTPRAIPIGGLGESVAAWASDGKEIVARTPKGWIRVPAAGSDSPQPIPSLGTTVRAIAFSKHGNRMAYALIRGDTNIWRIDLKAKVPVPQRIIASTFRDVYPQFSPDGRQIAFQSARTGDKNQIWMCDADGSRPRQMTFVKQGLAASPHWSPDGRTLEFDSNMSGKYQIYAMSPDGGKPTQLTQGPSLNYDGNWSRDGQWIYLASNRSGRTEVWKMPSAGGEPVQVTHNGGTRAIESPDGKTLYFSKEAGDGSIWKVPVDGGPEEQLANSLNRDNFAVSPLGIYYMTAPLEDGTASLKFYSFATRVSTTVSPMGRPDYGLDLSPDGRYLAYAQIDDPASDLMLVENFH